MIHPIQLPIQKPVMSLDFSFAGIISGGPAYDPGMMTLDGSTGYYSKTQTTAGNVATGVIRFNHAAFTGGSVKRLFVIAGSSGYSRLTAYLYASDFATVSLRNKLVVNTKNSANTAICNLVSINDLADGSDHAVFYSFNGTTGSAIYYADGVDADDSGHASRVSPTVGVLDAGASTMSVGATAGGAQFFAGDIGYFGYREAYLTNPTDFYHPTNGLQEINESTWLQFGSTQPEFWNQFATMTDNKGSAGNMTANGIITGPA